VSESPAVAVKSSLHVRVTSNTGTPLATATTNCELKAIIETEIGILVTPCPITLVSRKSTSIGTDCSRPCEIGILEKKLVQAKRMRYALSALERDGAEIG
jgi:hypothetical protein